MSNMNTAIAYDNPRSQLHALQPKGVGTPDVESLLSYFCRLTVSHSTSTLIMSRAVARWMKHEISPNYDWHERQIAGHRESALTWSSALSALTTVPKLDELTFLPWKNVIAQNGLSIVTRGQFCPHCLFEDRADGGVPYFRLAWEAAVVKVCHRHKTPLVRKCMHCNHDNIRHAAAFVVPGWCTHCGNFLGVKPPVPSDFFPPKSDDLWNAKQVGELLAAQGITQQVCRETLIDSILRIIAEIDGGKSSVFAKRVGIGKSTVHHWLKGDGTPTLSMSLQIAALSGMSLLRLVTGNFSDWQAPTFSRQIALKLLFENQRERAPARQLDWVEIELRLQEYLEDPMPISVLEAARRLGVEARQLYLRANTATRKLGERWKSHLATRHQENLARAWPHLTEACNEIMNEGKAPTRREVEARVPNHVLRSVDNMFGVLTQVTASCHAARHAAMNDE